MQTDWNKLQSMAIDWLRFPMAVLVVMLHYSKTIIEQADGTLHFLCIFFQEGICRLAVPCFFFISGFLFFGKLEGKWDWSIWKDKLAKRAKTLLLPYLLWNIIAFFAFWIYERTNGNVSSLTQAITENGGVRMFWSVTGGIPIGSQAYPVNGPLWFIRDLVFYIIVTPLVFMFIKWTRLYGILALCLLHLTVNRLVPEGFLFFSTGAWFRLSRKNIVESLAPGKIIFYIIAILSLVGLILIQYYTDSDPWKKIVKFIFLTSGIATSFCGVARLLDAGKTRVIPFLAGSSFFIFASHEVLILQNISTPVIKALLPDGITWDLIAFFAVPALTVAICIGLLFFMQRILPRTTAILTGGRRVGVAYNA